jgi:hypothetical protein
MLIKREISLLLIMIIERSYSLIRTGGYFSVFEVTMKEKKVKLLDYLGIDFEIIKVFKRLVQEAII